jgi:hypothetical protein
MGDPFVVSTLCMPWLAATQFDLTTSTRSSSTPTIASSGRERITFQLNVRSDAHHSLDKQKREGQGPSL